MHKDQVHCYQREDKVYDYRCKKLVDLLTWLFIFLIEVRNNELILQSVRGLGSLRRKE